MADPFPLWAGLMDTMEAVGGTEPRVSLACESRLVDLERAEVRRYVFGAPNFELRQLDPNVAIAPRHRLVSPT